jgi:hypothetical protein
MFPRHTCLCVSLGEYDYTRLKTTALNGSRFVSMNDTMLTMHNAKTNLREIRWGGVEWIDLAQDTDHFRTVANTVINLPFL